ncbi:LEA type 2 family protein [Luteimonas arsenica]|uniref:NDR1/HIN1-like protein n=1 Tax=Luteimonas arsenica TaxID=1586242 RepID=UPI001055D95E|nr:LEA type 2 family protein [Luteimonas arsenica]
MGRRFAVIAVSLLVLLAASCSTGPARRISEPAASIQQLAVQTDGSWSISLRLQNYSSIPMRFDTVDLALSVDGQAAGTLRDAPALEIGPESADVIEVRMQPEPGARMLLADALAGGRGVGYEFDGTIDAIPTDRGSSRSYPVKRKSALSPTPGLPGVLR